MLSNKIISERLILREMAISDAKDVWEIWNNSGNQKYMGDPVESQEEIISICQNNKNGDDYLTVATLKNTGEIIGTCCFGPTSRKEEWGFGYSIKENFWGKGYATEIVKSVIEFGYGLGVRDFVSSCAIENTGSWKVMEKCGMKIDRKSTIKQPKTNTVYESYVYRLHLD